MVFIVCLFVLSVNLVIFIPKIRVLHAQLLMMDWKTTASEVYPKLCKTFPMCGFSLILEITPMVILSPM